MVFSIEFLCEIAPYYLGRFRLRVLWTAEKKTSVNFTHWGWANVANTHWWQHHIMKFGLNTVEKAFSQFIITVLEVIN